MRPHLKLVCMFVTSQGVKRFPRWFKKKTRGSHLTPDHKLPGHVASLMAGSSQNAFSFSLLAPSVHVVSLRAGGLHYPGWTHDLSAESLRSANICIVFPLQLSEMSALVWLHKQSIREI